MILGMMIGSFYAIIQGPTTLAVLQAAMSPGTFQILSCLAGITLVLGMQILSTQMEKRHPESRIIHHGPGASAFSDTDTMP